MGDDVFMCGTEALGEQWMGEGVGTPCVLVFIAEYSCSTGDVLREPLGSDFYHWNCRHERPRTGGRGRGVVDSALLLHVVRMLVRPSEMFFS